MRPTRSKAMDTGRLRAIQNPASASDLLESLAATHELRPAGSYRLWRVDELSAPLQRLAQRSEADGTLWTAQAEGSRMWFFSAAPSLELSRERRRPVLQVRIHNERGELLETFTCVHTSGREWKRCT